MISTMAVVSGDKAAKRKGAKLRTKVEMHGKKRKATRKSQTKSPEYIF